LAITAIRSGRKEEGRQLLNLLIQQNPNDEMAWLWMSSVVNTDEQRARCLYHVLAINPESDIARRGLEVLGIVVSDSRPVKIPRDSQPIPIQRTGEPLPEIPSPPVAPAPAERRPFRVDPRAITQELPFKPLKEPFTQTSAETAPTSDPQVVEAPAAVANEQRGHPSAFKQVTNASSTLSRLTEKLEQVTQSSGPAPAASTASAGPDTQTAQANSSSAAQTNPDLAAHYAPGVAGRRRSHRYPALAADHRASHSFHGGYAFSLAAAPTYTGGNGAFPGDYGDGDPIRAASKSLAARPAVSC
jgi:hypothetical protein